MSAESRGGWRLEAGGWRKKAGGWRLAAGGWCWIAKQVLPLAAALAGSCAAPAPPAGQPGAVLGSLLLLDLVESHGGTGGGPYLADLLRHPVGQVRARAARAAGRWGRPPLPPEKLGGGLNPLLISMARFDPEPVARAEAIFALGQLGEQSSSAALAALTLDPSPSFRSEALLALGKLPGVSPGLLFPALSDPTTGPRGSAALALARQEVLSAADRREMEPLLLSGIGAETDEGARWRLYYLLASHPELLSDRRLRGAALLALKDPNFLAAAFAATALGAGAAFSRAEGGQEESPEVLALGRLLADRTRFWIPRAAAARALALHAGRVVPATGSETGPAGAAGPPARDAAGLAPPAPEALPTALARLAADEAFSSEAAPLRRAVAAGMSGKPTPFPEILTLAPAAPKPAAGPRRRLAAWRLRRNPRAVVSVAGRGKVRLEVLFDQAPRVAAAFVEWALDGRLEGSPFRTGKPAELVAASRSDAAPASGPSPAIETGRAPFSRGSLGALEVEGREGIFFTFLPAPLLDGRFPLFARVIEGMEVIDRIEEGDRVESVVIDGPLEEDREWKPPAH